MKNYLLAGGLATILLLGACGDDTESGNAPESTEDATQEEETEVVEDTNETEEHADVEAETDSDKGSRTNPYAVGETAEITVTDYDDDMNLLEGKANVTIDNVMRGEEAFNQLNEEIAPAMQEQPDEEGMEWMLFDLEFELLEYVDDDTSYTFATAVTFFNEDGEQVPSTFAARGEAAGTTVFQGGTVTSQEAYTAPSEGKVLIKINDAEEDIYFEVE